MNDFKYEGRDLEAMSFAGRYHEWILSEFRPFLGTRIAEVGAGAGNFLSLLLREPVEEVTAIEPSSDMYARLRSNVSGNSRVTTRNTFFSEVSKEYADHFDSIVYVNVLEHVEDDVTELSHMYGSLKPGGHVCIFVPALPWLYGAHDASIGHYRRYYKKQLVAKLSGAGFAIVRVRYFDFFGVLPWLLVVRLLGKEPTVKNVDLYSNLVVPVARILESFISPPIGKSLVIVGKKPLETNS